MALLEVLANRPKKAADQFETLENLLPQNPWPSAYRSLVTLAGWNPWKASSIAKQSHIKKPNIFHEGLADLSGVLGGAIWRLPSASRSIPKAIKYVETEIQDHASN